MRMVYHLGPHCTDEDKLLRCLLRNLAELSKQATEIADPARYRKLLRDTAVQLRGQRATPEVQSSVLTNILGQIERLPERLVLSWENFLSFPQWALEGQLYPHAGERIRAFTRIFPQFESEFHMAIRNPATFLPALFIKQRDQSHDAFFKNCNPLDLRWSDTIRQISKQNPEVPLYIWCDEDSAILWPELLARLAGTAGSFNFTAADEILMQLLSPEGLSRYRNYIASHPPATTLRHSKVISAFLEKFADPARLDQEVSMPGWTQEYVDALTENYFTDLARIRLIPGVQLILPQNHPLDAQSLRADS